MNTRILRTIVYKDLKEVSHNRGAWAPAVIVPFIFMVILPALVIAVPSLFDMPMDKMLDRNGPVGMMLQNIPSLSAELQGLTPSQLWIVITTGYLLAPFLLIMPLMFSTIVGAESFVGEKERKTLEALIYTPATDAELFVGKVLASVLPAVALAWLSFLVYAIVVNVAAWPVMGRVWFPLLSWWPLMLLVAPGLALLGMGVTVLISTRVNTFMEAYQLSGSLVVIVLGFVVGQVTGVLYLSFLVTVLVGLVLWLIDGVLIWFGVRTFARSALLARL